MDIFFISCIVCVITCIDSGSAQVVDMVSESAWEAFKVENLVSFNNPAVEEKRKGIFLENKRMIDAHNELYRRGLVSYKLEMNQFGYLEDHEITSMVTGYRQPDIIAGSDFVKLANGLSAIEVPPLVDWRNFGVVTDIKNQGRCGSCWAFSATGALEAQLALKTGQLVPLSEQNLIDCAVGNSGCSGGFMASAFQYIKDNKGIEFAESYPLEKYNPKMNSSQCCAHRCRYKPKFGVDVGIEKIVQLPQGDENAMRVLVSLVGPVSVGIVATGDFHFYKEGVYFKKDYNSTMEMTHAVLVVGYGITIKGEEYWLLKNSWGTEWGVSGYMLMARNRGNHCHIASAACYPSLDPFPPFFDQTSRLTNKNYITLLT